MISAERKTKWIIAVCITLIIGFVFLNLESYNYSIVLIGIAIVLIISLIPEKFLNKEIQIQVFRFSIQGSFMIDVLLSILCTFILFFTSGRTFFDDVGFTLRYLDYFREGYFYTFNQADGPVLGISGFLNTLLCGVASRLHILDSHKILLLSNTAGIFLVSLLLLKILRLWFQSFRFVLFIWLLTMFCTKSLINVAFTGIETPFHLSVILFSFYFLLTNNHRLYWLFTALCLVSKLDALPLVMVSGLLFLYRNKDLFSSKSEFLKHLKIFAFYAVLPMIIWTLSVILIFGSPLPQSAFAKVNFYSDPGFHWFPFLATYLNDNYLLPVVILFSLLMILQLLFIKKNKFSGFLPGFGFISSLIFYYFYNPGEKMMWYYAVPSFLLIMQTGVSSVLLFDRFIMEKGKMYSSLYFCVLFIFLGTDVSASVKWMKKSMNVVENERILIGKYLGDISTVSDTLLSKHGHISRYFKGYVIDNSGLNSRLATDYQMNTDSLIITFHPRYAINHAWPDFIETMNRHSYRLKSSFYDISLYDSYHWMLFERTNKRDTLFNLKRIEKDSISGYSKDFNMKYTLRLRGNTLRISINKTEEFEFSRLIAGFIRQHQPYELRFKIYAQDSILSEKKIRVEKIGRTEDVSRFVKEVQVDMPAMRHPNHLNLEINRLDGEEVVIINPFIELRKVKSRILSYQLNYPKQEQ